MTAAVSLRQPQARDVWLPTPSRADRDVPRASKGHCIVHAVFGDGEGVRVQAESLLEHKWQLILSARPETLELREQVLFRWGDRPTDKHVFDMVVKERSGRRIAYTVKPEIRLRSGRFLAEMQEVAHARGIRNARCEPQSALSRRAASEKLRGCGDGGALAVEESAQQQDPGRRSRRVIGHGIVRSGNQPVLVKSRRPASRLSPREPGSSAGRVRKHLPQPKDAVTVRPKAAEEPVLSTTN